MSTAHEIIESLLRIDAVQIRPDRSFTWTSGIKSPIYCDNRLTIGYPEVRKQIVRGFVEIIERLPQEIDGISGCATAGIPHAAFLSEHLNLPMSYVRGSAKKHGKQNQIEGVVKKGDKVVVIEDLISTGGSVIESVEALRAEGVEVVKVLAIFSYGLEQATQAFKSANIPFETLANFDQLAKKLRSEDKITSSEFEGLIEWRNQLS